MMEMPVKLSQNSDGLIKLKGKEGRKEKDGNIQMEYL